MLDAALAESMEAEVADRIAEDAATSYREAPRQAHREALARDERVFLMGGDVGRYGGAYAVSMGVQEAFGEERVRDAPEVDGASLDPAIPPQDQIDLDSMDFLSLVLRVNELTGIDIPERDYPLLSSLDAGARYLARAG